MKSALITGWGKCTPPAVLSNADLASFLDTSDEWIVTRTGIRERRISHVLLSDLAAVASRHALAAAGVDAGRLDLLILATASPETLIPSAASRLQLLLGAERAAAVDINAACTGFLYGLSQARSAIRAGDAQTVLVVGADMLTWYLDWSQRDTAVLFGDGAGAAVVQASDDDGGILGAVLGCDSGGNEILKLAGFGTGAERYEGEKGDFSIQFDGREIFKRAVVQMGRAAEAVLERTGLSAEELDLVVPHQANLRIIEALMHKLALPPEKVVINVQDYGNTSAATIPIALTEALEQGRVRPGARILMASFGAGLTWGAVTVQWGQRIAPVALSDAALPPPDKTALELLAGAIEHSRRLAAARCR